MRLPKAIYHPRKLLIKHAQPFCVFRLRGSPLTSDIRAPTRGRHIQEEEFPSAVGVRLFHEFLVPRDEPRDEGIHVGV